MDPYSSAQNVLRCDLCEIEILHSYCDFLCQPLYIFCKPCVVDHIWAEYDEHKMVLLKQRRSTLICPKCKARLRNTCKYQCKDCNDTYFCSSCTASEQYRHNKIDTIIYEMKTEINEKKIKHKDILQNTFGWSKIDTVYQQANVTGRKGNREIHRKIANF